MFSRKNMAIHFKNETINRYMKNVKGTCDFDPEQLKKRRNTENIIRQCYNQFGGKEYQTPLLEKTCFLQKKYGDDTKLIFNIESDNSDKEQCSLRYDLTVPLTRYCLKNSITKKCLYQIGKVYRKDTPNITGGRFREFTQCDFDIIGSEESELLLPETTLLFLATTILDRLSITNFKIKVNNRQDLVSVLTKSGIKETKMMTVCSSIDKLDKQSWDDTITELLSKEISIDKILMIKDKLSLKTEEPSWFNTLMKNAKILGFQDKLVLTPTLARGMDYYTGMIYEIYCPESSLGTIISGGRYDNLTKAFRNVSLPMCGISIGLDRIMMLEPSIMMLEPSIMMLGPRRTPTLIYRTSNDEESINKQLKRIKYTDFDFEIAFKSRSLSKHAKYAEKNNLSFS
jgi:histidyl-tRNA synthetase